MVQSENEFQSRKRKRRLTKQKN